MWGVGSILFVVFTVAMGLAQTGIQVILFRTCLGMAISMCLPATVSLITNTFPHGSWRNAAFSINGMAQPLGYALGLVLGGVLADTVGWRWAYFIMAILCFLASVASMWSLPKINHEAKTDKTTLRRLIEDIDWVGAIMMSVALGMLMYVLALASSSYKNLATPQSIVMLVISLLLIVLFPFWMHHQESRKKPALIPNRVWNESSFAVICVSVFLCWGSLNGFEYFTTLL